MVIHYNKDMCGTNAKSIKDTDDKSLVTCKRCLNKMKKSTMNKIKVEIDREFTTLTFKKFQFTFKTYENNDMFMFSAPEGYVYTSIMLNNTNIKRIMIEKDRLYFKNLFEKIKTEYEFTGENIYKYLKE